MGEEDAAPDVEGVMAVVGQEERVLDPGVRVFGRQPVGLGK